MAVYAMSDLHLALSNPEKTMEVFGSGWDNYMERIKEGFSEVKPEDTVLMPGDLSWAMYLEDAEADLRYIEALPGRKLICRGNHDYWWTTAAKMRRAFEQMGVGSIEIVRNNAIEADGFLISGTRGWKLPTDDGVSEEDRRIIDRELIRIDLCVKALQSADPEHKLKWVMMLHYPPLTKTNQTTVFSEVLEKSGVNMVVYGHLHGRAHSKIYEGNKGGVEYRCVASDALKYKALRL